MKKQSIKIDKRDWKTWQRGKINKGSFYCSAIQEWIKIGLK